MAANPYSKLLGVWGEKIPKEVLASIVVSLVIKNHELSIDNFSISELRRIVRNEWRILFENRIVETIPLRDEFYED